MVFGKVFGKLHNNHNHNHNNHHHQTHASQHIIHRKNSQDIHSSDPSANSSSISSRSRSLSPFKRPRAASPSKHQKQQQQQQQHSQRPISPFKRFMGKDPPGSSATSAGKKLPHPYSMRPEQRDDRRSRSKSSSKSRGATSHVTVTTAASSSGNHQELHDELDRLAALQPLPGTTFRIISPDHSSSTQPTTDSDSLSYSPQRTRASRAHQQQLLQQQQQQQYSSQRQSQTKLESSTSKSRVVSPLRIGRRQQQQGGLDHPSNNNNHQNKSSSTDPVLAAGTVSRYSRVGLSLFQKKLKRQPNNQQHQQTNSNNNSNNTSCIHQQKGTARAFSPKRRTAAPVAAAAPVTATAAAPSSPLAAAPSTASSSSSYGEATGVTYAGRHQVKIYAESSNSQPYNHHHHHHPTDATLPSSSSSSGYYGPPTMARSSSDLDGHQGGSSATGSLTLGSFSRTQVAGNLTMTPASLLLSGIVNLSLMRTPPALLAVIEEDEDGERKPDPTSKFMYMPSATRTVQESLDRHIQFQLSRRSHSSNGANGETGSGGMQQTTSFDAHNWTGSPSYSLDSSSLYEQPFLSDDRGDASSSARECLRNGNVEGAISVYQAALDKQHQTTERVVSFTAGSAAAQLDTYERVETLAKMSILLLYAGRNQEAMETANKASALILQDNPFAETRPLQAVMITMAVGLIHLSTGRVNKALQSWRQTIQTCCQALGYDHPIVAVLMNNIGVLHAETGDTMAASKALEESLMLQRALLKSGPHTDTDYALHQMATTMSNLAMVLELQEEFTTAINYLQESQALYESVEDLDEGIEAESTFDFTFTSGSFHSNPSLKTSSSYHHKIQRIVHHHLDRMHDARQEYLDRKVRNASSTLLESKSDGSSETSESTEDPEACEDAVMASLVEKRSSIGKHAVQQGHRKTLQLSDIYDYILLGSIRSEWTPRERVRETVLAWFGRPSAKTNARSALPFSASLFGLTIGAKTQITTRETISGTWESESNPSSLMMHAKMTAQSRASQSPVDTIEKIFSPVRAQIMEYVENDEPAEALLVCQSALNGFKAAYSEDHALVGMALHMIGMLHLLAEEYLQAYGVLKEAVRVRKAAHGVDDAKVASTMMKLALLQYAAMDIPASGRTMGEIRGTYLKVMGFGHPHLAQIMNNIAILRYEQGDIGAAIRALEIAYEYQRKIIEDSVRVGEEASVVDSDHTQVAEVVMAYTLSNIAFLYYHKDDQLSSLKLYEEARVILSRHAPPSDRVMIQIQDSIECLMGRGVDMVPCDERCKITGQGALAQSAQCSPNMSNIHKMWRRN